MALVSAVSGYAWAPCTCDFWGCEKCAPRPALVFLPLDCVDDGVDAVAWSVAELGRAQAALWNHFMLSPEELASIEQQSCLTAAEVLRRRGGG